MEPKIQNVKNHIEWLSELNLNNFNLNFSGKLIHVESKFSEIKVWDNEEVQGVPSQMKQAVKRIQEFLTRYPILITDPQAMNSLFTLSSHIHAISPEVLTGIKRLVTERILNHDRFNHLTLANGLESLGEDLVNEEAGTFFHLMKAQILRENIFANQFACLLKRYLKYSYDDIQKISLCLCRKISKMAANVKKYQGKSVRLTLENIQHELKCWLEMSEDVKMIKVSIILPSILDQGLYKILNPIHQFSISRNLDEKTPILYEPWVLIGPKNSNSSKGENVQIIKRGIKAQRKFLNKCSEEETKLLLPLPRERYPSANPIKAGPYELVQEWINCSFNFVTNHSCIPLDFSRKLTKPVNLLDKLMILLDVASILAIIHQKGYVHRDVAPKNILVQSKDKKLRGYLIDFDLLIKTKFAGENNKHNYCYWDLSAKNGWVTPFCDIYGLGMTLGEAVIPNFIALIRDRPHVLLNPESRRSQLNKIVVDFIQNIFVSKQNALNLLSLDLGPTATPKIIRKGIKRYIVNSSNSLSDRAKANLESVKRRLEVIEEVFNFIAELIVHSEKIYDSIKKDEGIQNDLRSKKMKERMRAIKELQKVSKFFSVEILSEELQKIILLEK